ncbi:MAG TPA: CHAP domain-containing protein, partial [Longimicrobiaceae bacterium]|nr:CHAP domain-containing protein [Longimicrobiaceae bacterium]
MFNSTLYGVPDGQTLRACTGGRDRVVREVSSLPSWTRRTLPSAGEPTRRPHGRDWLFGDRPVRSTTTGTVYLVVGCVKSGIPNPTVYNAIFNGDWSRIVDAPEAELSALPTGPEPTGLPLRRAGTLMESGGTITWVTYHGGSLGIPDPATMDSHCRGWSEMVSSSTEWSYYSMKGLLQPGSYSCVRGNDYPFAGKSYGTYRAPYDIDPWNYWYRECTSFVAFRLNQDGIDFHNQFGGYHWSHAYTWDDAARWLQTNNPALGVRINKTPAVGAIAQWNTNHVAYVAGVTTRGTVILEDYNGNSSDPG